MRKTLWQKRIPTLLGLLLIMIGIALTTYLVGTGTIVTTKAGPTETPQDVRITNLSDNSFTVSYTTEAQVIGSLNFGKDSPGETTLDDRDINGDVTSRLVHHITVKNLEPETQYYFSITSGSKTFMQGNSPYKVSTGPVIEGSRSEDTLIGGQVIFSKLPKEGVVYISGEETNTISTTVDENGNYSILLNSLRGKDLSSPFDFDENTVFNMLIQGKDSSSTVKFTIPKTSKLPNIILSENFDFTQREEEIPQYTDEILSSLNLQNQAPGQSPQIIIPGERQEFIDSQPRFSGTASPNSVVDIEINSTESLKAQVTTDSRGNWTYRPASPLGVGEHTITILARDSSGILRRTTRNFTVFASGTQVTESATTSGTPIPTIPIETLTPTPISEVPKLTPTPTVIPIATPIPTISPIPPPIEPPGISLTLLGIIGIGITGLGLFILLNNRSAPL